MLVSAVTVSCNDDEMDEIASTITTEDVSNGTGITAFSLIADDDVLENLDSVFFSIDLKNRVIYNADSLPKGTDITGLLIDVTYNTYGTLEVVQTGGTVRPDTTFTYSDEDSIDFTGLVLLKMTAQDGNEVSYTVKVNVHQMEPDSLYWNEDARQDLPFVEGTLLAQKAVKYDDQAYSLVQSSEGGYALGKISSPYSTNWQRVSLNFGFVPDVSSLTATEDALYMLDENGALYTSTTGETWSECGVTWTTIIGGYSDRVLGLSKSGDTYMHDEYPRRSTFTPTAADDEFPVRESSQMTYESNDWSDIPQALIVGGIDKNGKYKGDSWAYDGTNWAMLNSKVLPYLAGMTVFRYTTYETLETLETIEHRTWVAIGGRNSRGAVNETVYYSRHQGAYWSEADETMQLPDYVTPTAGAQSLIFYRTIYSAFTSTSSTSRSSGTGVRIAAPITSWECPYVYMFGGVDEDGNVSNNIWRGVLNRLTFKPLY